MKTPYSPAPLPVNPANTEQYKFAESVIRRQLDGTGFDFVGLQISNDEFPTFQTKRGEMVQQWQIFGNQVEDWQVGIMEWSMHESKLEAHEWKLAFARAKRMEFGLAGKSNIFAKAIKASGLHG